MKRARSGEPEDLRVQSQPIQGIFHFERLPSDLWWHVLGFICDPPTLLSAGRVCKTWTAKVFSLQHSFSLVGYVAPFPSPKLFSNLKFLWADGSKTPFSWIIQLPNLKSLNFALPGEVSDASARKLLGVLTKLEELNLAGCEQLTDNTATVIGRWLTNLEKLNMRSCDELTNTALLRIQGLTNLISLNISLCPGIGNLGISRITRLTNLQTLLLSDCNEITDAAAKNIAKLTTLTDLNLAKADLTIKGIKQLTTLTNLTKLNVYGIRCAPQVRNFFNQPGLQIFPKR